MRTSRNLGRDFRFICGCREASHYPCFGYCFIYVDKLAGAISTPRPSFYYPKEHYIKTPVTLDRTSSLFTQKALRFTNLKATESICAKGYGSP